LTTKKNQDILKEFKTQRFGNKKSTAVTINGLNMFLEWTHQDFCRDYEIRAGSRREHETPFKQIYGLLH
jgi:hypothetical protein